MTRDKHNHMQCSHRRTVRARDTVGTKGKGNGPGRQAQQGMSAAAPALADASCLPRRSTRSTAADLAATTDRTPLDALPVSDCF
ncbi:hypothetical protein BS78_10G060600 [Paspalum vaginatum]|nr:hypothetical protein BS78_10G060600 [Paspalum vaginatum]